VDLGARVDVDSHDDEVTELAGEFNSMLDRLEQATAARERLLATISHELRTPLAVAQGHLELAARSAEGDDETARAVAVARAELTRVNRLVSDLLALGRSGQAGFLQRRDLGLSELAREVELRIDGLGLDTVTVAPGDATVLHLDADRLLQAILNCVVNSIEHNPAGTTADVTWQVRGSTAADRELIVRVTDDGLGVPADLADSAFEPFVMGRSDRDPLRSSGLGLAVVAAVAAAHGGEASLGSADSGTVLELRIPCAPPSERR
jgi:two-component system OmpR family sensor kinase